MKKPNQRLRRAEQTGLRIAIMCRTAAVGLAFAWFLSWMLTTEESPSAAGLIALLVFTLIGIGHLLIIGGRFDRPWIKFAIYGADMAGICAVFAFAPLYSGGDVPQVIAFRAYGVHYLMVPVALACLSLSAGLVIWTGMIGVIGWWTAFQIAIRDLEKPLSWADLAPGSDADGYLSLILSPNFTGQGNRIEEMAFLLIISAVLALAVYRARRVFLAQVEAEAERERASQILGQYVPSSVAARLLEDGAALTPQVRHGVAMVVDVADFAAYAAARTPEAVIASLNDFLSAASDAVGRQGGVVISFTGDGLLATFNTPLQIDDAAGAACSAAQQVMMIGQQRGFAIRIGLAAGPLAAGSVGSSARRAFTVYGDTVNRAARLEALGKSLGETILMDGEAAAGIGYAIPLGTHRLRGIADEVAVYALPNGEVSAASVGTSSSERELRP
ncbi:MAG: adenylate/guanylate cyclase domain-containing protein [Pseudomonadota bacterium]